MRGYFKKKVPLYFEGRKHYALSSHLFQFLKVSSLTFVTKNYNLAKKQPSLLRFLKSYCIVMKRSCFGPELENHLAKTLYLGGKFVTNL